MRKNIKYWLLILLAINSLNLLGQSDSLIFKRAGGYSKNIPLNDFIFEINKNQEFLDKLRLKIIDKGELADTINVFSSLAGDEKISLVFNSNSDNKNVLGISMYTLLKAFERNPNFYTNFKNRGKTKQKKIETRNPLSSDSLLFEYLNLKKHATLKKGITKRLNASNFILNYKWEIAILGVLIAVLAWLLSVLLYKKKLFKVLNVTFFPDKSKEINNQYDIISYLQVKSNNDVDNKEIERLKSENLELQNNFNESERKLAKWIGISDGQSNEFIRDFLQKEGFYTILTKKNEFQTPTEEQGEIFYFASVNRDGDLGIFQDENKSFVKEPDSLYKFKVNKSNPHEAKFWFDASSSMAVASALSYPYYKIEPVCTSSNQFKEGQTRIIHMDKGTAILKDGRWIVEEGNKAKIKYE